MEPNRQNEDHVYGDGRGNFEVTGGERESWKAMAENLYHDVSMLWNKESMLIRSEINEKISDVKTAAVSLASGGVVLVLGAFSLVATAIIALALVVPLWASALIITAALFVLGGSMFFAAKKKLEANQLKPRKSIEALGEMSSTFKERMYEFRKH